MGIHQMIQDGLSNAVAAVNLLRSKLDPGDGDVVGQVDNATHGANSDTDTAYSEMWTVAGVQSRPKDGSEAAGYAKAITIQLGDTVYILGTHDPREMEPCQPGELVLHALGKDGARRAMATFKPDGEVLIQGTRLGVQSDTTEVNADIVRLLGATRVDVGSGPMAPMANGTALQRIVAVLLGPPIATVASGPDPVQAALRAALIAAPSISAVNAASSKHRVEM